MSVYMTQRQQNTSVCVCVCVCVCVRVYAFYTEDPYQTLTLLWFAGLCHDGVKDPISLT